MKSRTAISGISFIFAFFVWDFDFLYCTCTRIDEELHDGNQSYHNLINNDDQNIYSTRANLRMSNTTSAGRTRKVQSLRCNGLASLCDKPVNSVLFAAPHNANAALNNGYNLFPNQIRSLEAALNSGYRSIQVDIAKCPTPKGDKLKLIHGFCALGTRDPKNIFTNIYKFLEENRNEVILLVIENDFQSDTARFPLSEIDAVFRSIPGFKDRMYSHPDRLNPLTADKNSWPTLRQLIDLNQRIIMFTYNGDSCYAASKTCPTGFHDWFMYAAETEFQIQNIDQMEDISYSCKITRGGNGRKDFFGVNNFFQIPILTPVSTELNTESFVKQRINDCSSYNNGLDVNLLLVDFWHVGEIVHIVRKYNSAL